MRINGTWALCNVRKSFFKKWNAILFICLISVFARFLWKVFVCLIVYLFLFRALGGGRVWNSSKKASTSLFLLWNLLFFCQHTFGIVTIHMIWYNYCLLGKNGTRDIEHNRNSFGVSKRAGAVEDMDSSTLYHREPGHSALHIVTISQASGNRILVVPLFFWIKLLSKLNLK